MTFQNKQEKLFFGIIHVLTKGSTDLRLSEEEIIKNVTTKISREKAIQLFNSFSAHNVKYIEEDNSNKYRISDAGMTYYEQLYAEWEMEIEQRKIWRATTSSINWTKINIALALLMSATTLSVLLFTYNRDTNRYHKESEQQSKDTQRQERTDKFVLELKTELHQIYLSLSDTSTKKVKIEK